MFVNESELHDFIYVRGIYRVPKSIVILKFLGSGHIRSGRYGTGPGSGRTHRVWAVKNPTLNRSGQAGYGPVYGHDGSSPDLGSVIVGPSLEYKVSSDGCWPKPSLKATIFGKKKSLLATVWIKPSMI